MTDISIIVPLYNEEKVFNSLIQRLSAVIDTQHGISFEVLLIDDGSSDKTTELVENLCLTNEKDYFKGIFLSRNFGHQIAVSAGLHHSIATQACFIIDGDLQDPPELFIQFYSKFRQGFDVVYGVRENRKENYLKVAAYRFFYRILANISNINLPLDSGDFCLISARVRDKLNGMNEQNRYLRGMRSWVGFKQTPLGYERHARTLGESKYSFRKLLNLAQDGIFNFSNVPIKMITIIGLFTLIVSFSYLFYSGFKSIVYGNVPSGFMGLATLIVLFGSINLIAIGIIGEYIFRIFNDVKDRPLFIIDKIVTKKSNVVI